MTDDELVRFARRLRLDVLEMAHLSHESHIGSALSIADIIAVLYGCILKYDVNDPRWEGRDRFVLSKGHACSVLYAALAEVGFFPKEELLRQSEDGALLSGHVSSSVPGVECSTGSLGHGICVSNGMALAGKLKKSYYRVFCIVGNGECEEGSVWECAWFATQHRLDNFWVIVDQNDLQGMGESKNILDSDGLAYKWTAFGWNVQEVDGNDIGQLVSALFSAREEKRPHCVIAHTVKGKGVSFMEGDTVWHYRDPQGAFYTNAKKELEAVT